MMQKLYDFIQQFCQTILMVIFSAVVGALGVKLLMWIIFP